MTARELESQGIVTIVIGSAMDIVTHCKVPRYLHNDLPLGNPLGAPDDRASHRYSLLKAFAMTDATSPLVTVSDLRWPGDPDWKSVYNRIDDSNRDQLLKMGEENRRKRAENKAQGLTR
ncbi:MAG: hypothetical protein JJ934_08755 [Pseudomonadales bacterium]|nr:hypothetical protein [Pseudomonadales bacterium]MBO6597970.1 hypothetical protein [Pseudomonadales bacterium]MBO6656972.1 hypothetical protein [Pseudomonadales bacterium]MBO6704151.1 hypothetical protein [Pseudomonadales bacterium]MBO6823008.1 hypothetical protein [Pseudomonadales bacterium]